MMIALYPSEDVARLLLAALAESGLNTETVTAQDDLHLTMLAFDDDDATHTSLQAVCKRIGAMFPPIAGAISGIGRFNNIEGDGTHALYASVDAPALPDLYATLKRECEGADCSAYDDHGFTPYITLAYLSPESPTPDLALPPIGARFEGLTLVQGESRLYFPFDMESARSEADQQEPTMPTLTDTKTRHIRALITDQRSVADAAPGTPIRFIVATNQVGRDGLIIETGAWLLDNYRKNPVVLWGHDYTGRRLPIGRAVVMIEGTDLMADVTFDIEDEFALQIDRKYRRGFLNTTSVGWETLEMRPSQTGQPMRVTKAELLDISAVPVPGDPRALIQRAKQAALADLADPDTDTPPDDPNEAWEQDAAQMVRLFLPNALSERERRIQYNRLSKSYRKAGKEAPEFLTKGDLAPFGPDEVRGLFFEGEGDLFPDLFDTLNTRAGAVLSARNMNDLEEIVRLAQGMLERAKKPDEDVPTMSGDRAVAQTADPTIATLQEVKRLFDSVATR
jgi:hypothetical protein